MFTLAGAGAARAEDAERFARERTVEPLRLISTGNAKFALYAAPAPEDRDDRLEPHAWVHKISLDCGKSGFIERSRSWQPLPPQAASEATIHEWPAATDWTQTTSKFSNLKRKRDLLEIVTDYRNSISRFIDTSPASFLPLLHEWVAIRRRMLDKARYVFDPNIAIPFGAVTYTRRSVPLFLCLRVSSPHALLYALAPDDDARHAVRAAYISLFANKSTAAKMGYPFLSVETR